MRASLLLGLLSGASCLYIQTSYDYDDVSAVPLIVEVASSVQASVSDAVSAERVARLEASVRDVWNVMGVFGVMVERIECSFFFMLLLMAFFVPCILCARRSRSVHTVVEAEPLVVPIKQTSLK